MKCAVNHRPLCTFTGASLWRSDWIKAVERARAYRAPYRYLHP